MMKLLTQIIVIVEKQFYQTQNLHYTEDSTT